MSEAGEKIDLGNQFVLKGPGFYVNDYPSTSRKEGKKKEKEGPGKGQSGKGEEKTPEKKADPK